MTIKAEIILKIRQSKMLKLDLAIALNKSTGSIQRYLDKNDLILTTEVALEVISKHLGIPKDELLTKTETKVNSTPA